MASLSLAGMIGGFGQGLSSAAEKLQLGLVQHELMQSDRKFQLQKLAEQNEFAKALQTEQLSAQRAMHTESLQATATEGRETRAQAKELAGEEIKARERLQWSKIGSEENIAKEQRNLSERIAGDKNRLDEEISKRHDQLQRDLAKAELAWKKTHTEKSDLQAKIVGVSATLRDLSDEITRLNVAVSNPLADKTDPNYKASVEILGRAAKLHDEFVRYQAELTGMAKREGVESALTPKSPAPFKFPPGMSPAATPGSRPLTPGSTPPARSGGLIQTPVPSASEQEEMRLRFPRNP